MPELILPGCVLAFVLGICIGSFMNVVIWRLPRNGSLVHPQWSYCPNCNHRLSGADLIPLFSYVLRGRKCRYCTKSISSRYFWVELATGILFVVLYYHFRNSMPNAVSVILFGAILVPIFCVDLELFEIPHQLNLLVFAIAIGRDIYGIAVHEPGHAPLFHFIPISVVGAVMGTLIFGLVRVLGWIWKRQEAMGLGDVILARAMGAMLVSFVPLGSNPLRLLPIWVLFSCGSGAIIGPLMIYVRGKQVHPELAEEANADQIDDKIDDDESTIGRELMDIGHVLWLQDAFEYALMVISRKKGDNNTPHIEDDDWTPAASAVPFGPFMVAGFVATLLVGETVTALYLAYAIPRAISPGLFGG